MSELINVDLGDGRIFPMESHLLEGPFYHWKDNAHERTCETTYRYQGKEVHRSVSMHLKQGIGIEGALGSIG